jgi:type IV pilus assembly protein PilY1
MVVLSDINPSYDTDQLPGVRSGWGSSIDTSLGTLSVNTLANTISNEEGISGSHYIGQSGKNDDRACTSKNVAGLGDIRGLCPEEPSKSGGYYSASVAYYGRKEDIHSTAAGDQKIITYGIGLSSPLPRIEIPMGEQIITLVPFGKSVGGYGITPAEDEYQPTNTIVDFFVEEISPNSGRFRINFEDVEQGADHDMDAIVIYEYQVNSDNTLTVTLSSEYAASNIIQHMGYIISGTMADGSYLEVRDRDTAESDDPDYFLDTPPGQGPGGSWNDGQPLPFVSTRTFTPGSSPTTTLLKNPLWYAAKWGGYEDTNDNNDLDLGVVEEWDEDRDGIPDTYFYVQNSLKLENQLNQAFMDIAKRVASGTAVSTISTSRYGEGAIYQAVFYPEHLGVNWVGEVYALLVDKNGNMREDTNQNQQLDLEDDLIIEFEKKADDSIKISKFEDSNANSRLEDSERSTLISGTIANLQYLWSASEWLNGITDNDIVTQRVYGTSAPKRYIFTFADDNQNMLPDAGEVLDFVAANGESIQPYLHLFPPFQDKPAWVPSQTLAFQDFLSNQRDRVINFIRGKDQGAYESSSYSYTIPAFRSRQTEGGKACRIGDVVSSTPTVVGPPSEQFDLLYKDSSYVDFFQKYANRRLVLYAGGNDGMLHAFNSGFYDPSQNKFRLAYDPDTGQYSDTGLDLGAELWAYIPYNLLPHLYWLTEGGYGGDVHVSYVDLKPKIFDAKIFTPDTKHPNGWGTVLVGGMGFGGGKIPADVNKDNKYRSDDDRTMSSAFFIMDITDPQEPPVLLAEIRFDGLGFTTSYPAVIVMKDKDPSKDDNNWYLFLGSGPIGASGADRAALTNASSTQPAKIVLLDLKKLAANGQIYSLDSSGTLSAGVNTFAELDNNSFIAHPVVVDYDLDYKADVVYFGTVSGSQIEGWGGKLRRIVINNDPNPANWNGNSTLIDLTSNGKPIVSAPTVALDNGRQRWVYFGTGRLYNQQDSSNTNQQSFYGIKEYYASGSGTYTCATVLESNLVDVSNVVVTNGSSTVDDKKQEIAAGDGWIFNFPVAGEKNLGQAALLGDILTFTTYFPSQDTCKFEGESNLYALYFATGTAYFESVIGVEEIEPGGVFEISKKKYLGRGLIISPSIYPGSRQGSKVFVQTSSGAILETEQQNPGITRSGKVSWDEWP